MINDFDRILIVATPRSGSTNLMISMSSAYSVGYIFEPTDLNSVLNEKKIIKYVPKVIFTNEKEETIYYGDLIDSIKKFSTIILLDRHNKMEQAESLYCLENYKTFYKRWGNEAIDKESEQFKQIFSNMSKMSGLLEKISKDISVEIDYYEDLYYGNGLKNRNIKLDLSLFDKKYKLRQVKGHLI